MLESVFSAALVAAIVALIMWLLGELGIPVPPAAKPFIWLAVAIVGYLLGGLIQIDPELAPIIEAVVEILIIILTALGFYEIGSAVKRRL